MKYFAIIVLLALAALANCASFSEMSSQLLAIGPEAGVAAGAKIEPVVGENRNKRNSKGSYPSSNGYVIGCAPSGPPSAPYPYPYPYPTPQPQPQPHPQPQPYYPDYPKSPSYPVYPSPPSYPVYPHPPSYPVYPGPTAYPVYPKPSPPVYPYPIYPRPKPQPIYPQPPSHNYPILC